MIFQTALRKQVNQHFFGMRRRRRGLEFYFCRDFFDVKETVLEQWVGAYRLGDNVAVRAMHHDAGFQRFAPGEISQAVEILPGAAGLFRNQGTDRLATVIGDRCQPAELDLFILKVRLAQPKIRNDGHQQGVSEKNTQLFRQAH